MSNLSRSLDSDSSPTRRRILDAGLEIWRKETPSTLFSGLSVARVASTAKVTRSTFYSYWPTADEYVGDLLRYLIDLDATNVPRIVNDMVREPTSSSETFTDIPHSIVSDCTLHLLAASEDPTLGMRLGFLSKADDPAVAEALRELYRRTEELQYAPVERGLELWVREIRAPFTHAEVSIVFSTLLEGLAIRHRLDPSSFSPELYGRIILPLLITLTRRPDDERDIYEITDSLNNWSAVGLSMKLREHETSVDAQSPTIAKGSIREVTIAVRRLLARVGFGELSMSEIALVTGYSEYTLQQMFGSRPGIALCLLYLNSYERYLLCDETLRGVDRIRAYAAIYFDELQRSPVIAQNMLILLSGHIARPRTDLIDFNPRPLFDEAVSEAFRLGELSSQFDPQQFSSVLQRSVLLDGSPVGLESPDIRSFDLILQAAGAVPFNADPDGTTVSHQ